MNKPISACVFITFTFVCASAYGESLNAIVKFAKEMCDEIKSEGTITRTEIEAKVAGNTKGLAKALGLTVGADGRIKKGTTQYTGIPFENLSKEMSNARECRQDFGRILIDERMRISSNRNYQEGDENEITQKNLGRQAEGSNQRNESKQVGRGNRATQINQ